jgi:hypothetical protein
MSRYLGEGRCLLKERAGKKLAGTAAVYLLLLALLVWFRHKKKTDPEFAARAAQRKSNPAPDAKRNATLAPLYILIFHLLFLALVLTLKHVLDDIPALAAMRRTHEIILATAAATALAGVAVMGLAGFNDRRRKSRVAAQA